ncbi:MAG: UDP-N-acetylmuramate:L-alanyl-gamma-D-glutamyl-meso-diaminopimelate ligase [Gammaproteobacteria bacterium]|nr:UDP-N-acetylmuramate:L-alanyl-gamma-D-glutamyl-meso-diaminopimelate ligase [Gammaproteobacteria bacterium]
MHIHVLGICGKFMSGLAIIAKQQGFKVSGSDQNLSLSVSDALRALGIELVQGYEKNSLPKDIDCVVIGNALSRGCPIVEEILNRRIPYVSGPEWLSKNILEKRFVLAVSGTHGKTTTTSMLAWILESAGLNPGFLIGGNPSNFDFCARFTDSNFFVIEADEYDTAFFDKRSKFLHYQPTTLIINNLEFDHADIFASLEDIKKQFAHLLRIVPENGLIVAPSKDENVQSLFSRGCWTKVETFDSEDACWTTKKINAEGSQFQILNNKKLLGTVEWELLGDHNIQNALAAIAAARHAGVPPTNAINALCQFKGVKRRLELKGIVRDIHVYDDFAHHPTAIATTISALRNRVKNERIFAVLELGSNTMRAGFYQESMPSAFLEADKVILLRPKEVSWNIEPMMNAFKPPVKLFDNVQQIVSYLSEQCRAGDNILCMSNLMFDGIHQKLLNELSSQS